MKTTSVEYNSLMAQQIRNRAVARVVFPNVITWTRPYGVSFPGLTELADYVEISGFCDNTLPIDSKATLEFNRWVLDGEYHTDDIVCNGIVSSDFVGTEDTFTFYLDFGNQFVRKIELTFDEINGVYPINVSGYFIYSGSDIQPFSVDVEGNTATIECRSGYENTEVYSVEITINGCRVPNTRARIGMTKVYGSWFFDETSLVSCDTTNDVDAISRRLPTETCEFTINDYEGEFAPDNPDGKFSLFKDGEKFFVMFGIAKDDDNGIIFLAPDYYNLCGRPTRKNDIMTFKGKSIIGRLAEVGTKYTDIVHATNVSQWASISFKSLIGEILTSVNITEYELDDLFDNMNYKTIFYLDTQPVADALQLIAHTCNCRLCTDYNDKIHIEKWNKDLTVVKTLTKDDILKSGLVYSQTDLLGKHTATSYKNQYTDAISRKEGTITRTAKVSGLPVGTPTTITINFDDNFLMAFSKWRTTEMQLYFAIKVNGESIVSLSNIDKDNTYSDLHNVYLTGTFASSYVEVEVQATVLTPIEKTVISRTVESGGADNVEETTLINNDVHLQDFWSFIANYLKLHHTYTFAYRGNPEIETGDVINIDTGDKVLKCYVLCNEINYNGAFKGNLTVKVLEGM